MSDFVLDASALLALLNDEPGADLVASALAQASVSAVNYSEVVAKLADSGMPEDAIREALDGLGLDVVAFDSECALAAGLLRPVTKALGLGLGDRACLALSKSKGAVALTTDRVWQDLNFGVAIQMIR